jgi:hypothetical protein
MMSSIGSATAAADGTFQLTHIAPGEYRISARGAEAGSQEGTTQAVTVDGNDIEGLVLAATAGGSISGQVVTEGDTPLPIPLSRMRVSVRSVDGLTNVPVLSGSTNGAVNESGRFEFSGIVGIQRLAVAPVPDGWALKAIEREGADVADLDITMRSGEHWDVKVVLTNKLATLTGSVSVDRDDQAGTGTVVVFRAEPGLWGDASRHIRAMRPSQTGEFEAKGLLPGRYFAVALEYLPEGDWVDPDVLRSLTDRATRFTLAEGDTRELRLKLTR